MKYFFLSLFLILMACSYDKNSTYWNRDSVNKSLEIDKFLNVSKKNEDSKTMTISDFETMTFDQFNLFLKEYSNESTYPDINN